MALVLKTLYMQYKRVNELEDPRSSHWPLMSPVQIGFVLTAYIVFVKNLGPKIMENRKPYDLKLVIMVYNVLQILLNGYIAIKATPLVFRRENMFCIPIDYGHSEDALQIHFLYGLYFLLKVSDLLDTVFFILRKKYNQVTFLHFYHHTLMAGVVWMLFKFFPGGHSIYTGLFNCYIHVAMYSYYLLSALDGKYKASTFFKKNITRLQLIQFCLIYFFYVPMVFMEDCNYPRSLLLLFLPQNTLMILLFSDFYYKAYIKKKHVK